MVGDRIPAYYCQDCGEMIVFEEEPEFCKSVKAADCSKMKMFWIRGSAQRYGLFQPWMAGRDRRS